MTYTYQVEYEDDDNKLHVEPYEDRRSAAQSRARRVSEKHVVAYVVACHRYRDEAPCGQKVYGQGHVTETEGEGF